MQTHILMRDKIKYMGPAPLIPEPAEKQTKCQSEHLLAVLWFSKSSGMLCLEMTTVKKQTHQHEGKFSSYEDRESKEITWAAKINPCKIQVLPLNMV